MISTLVLSNGRSTRMPLRRFGMPTSLLAQAMAFVAIAALAASPSALRAQSQDIIATATADGSFKTMTRLLNEAGLATILRGPGPFTVFAPTDEAFSKLEPGALDALAKDRSRLRSILLYHVIAGRITAADAVKLAGTTRKTVEGPDAKLSAAGGTPMINNARVVKGDIMARNGVIHGIDAVMIPPAR